MRSRLDINERKGCILVRSSAPLLCIWFRDIQALWSTMWKMQNRPIRTGHVVSRRSLQSLFNNKAHQNEFITHYITYFMIRYWLISTIKSDKFIMVFISRLLKKLVVPVNRELHTITNYVKPVRMGCALIESDSFLLLF
jgi:hypothetical protein